jgi:rSAM/selenodomain-associated transferase 2
MNAAAPAISVVIPVLHEAEAVNAVVRHVRSLDAPGTVEIIVVDGAPEADTLAALAEDATGLAAPRGRARQMNAGARAATGDILLFLHADTLLPPHAPHLIARAIAAGYAGGAFDLGFPPGAGAWLRFIAAAANWRSHRTRVPYGDQAQFFSRQAFELLGGFREITLMEDLDIMARAHARGERITLLPERVRTSARRFREEGALYCSLRNLALRGLYHLGVHPDRLARYYRFSRRRTDG